MPKNLTLASLEDEEGLPHQRFHWEKSTRQGLRRVHPDQASQRISQDFRSRPRLCGFCVTTEVAELRSKEVKPKEPTISIQLTSLFNSDSNQRYSRNVRILGIKEKADEDVYEVLHVAPGLMLKFRRKTESATRWRQNSQLWQWTSHYCHIGPQANKKKAHIEKCNLKIAGKRVFINDDLTLLSAS